MRRTITRIGAVGAGAVLALGLLVAGPPAGASSGHGAKAGNGKVEAEQRGRADRADRVDRADQAERPDRATCLTTEGHTQGRSQSDPDGMSNGGPDKPGCTGGFDDDRDGNNGCGNDADREDDNNGRCGKGEEPDLTTPDTDDVAPTVDDDTADGTDVAVLAASAGTNDGTGTPSTDTAANGPGTSAADVVADATATGTAPDTAAAEVQTEVLGETLERSPGVLARTGAGIGGLALLGGLLCGGGRMALLARRFLRIG